MKTQFQNTPNQKQMESTDDTSSDILQYQQRNSNQSPTVLEDFIIIEPLGSGSYGDVNLARNRRTGDRVAIKKNKPLTESTLLASTTLREISILAQLNHPNIIKLLHVFFKNKHQYLLLEVMDIDLKQYLIEKGAIQEQLAKSFLYQLLSAIQFMHQNKIMHRDLKPSNILIGLENGNIKIADFGLAREGQQTDSRARPFTRDVITLTYRPPEIILGEPIYGYSADIWSLGAIMVEMLVGAPIFNGRNEIDTLINIFRVLGSPDAQYWERDMLRPVKVIMPQYQRGQLTQMLNLYKISDQAQDLIEKMLVIDQYQRISAYDALRHPYFEDIR